MIDKQTSDSFVVIGAGLAGLFCAYHLLNEARQSNKKIYVTVIAETISAPCGAGSHIINEIDGFYMSDETPSSCLMRELREGLQDLSKLIHERSISCRFNIGYEMKARTEDEYDYMINKMIEKNIFKRDEIIENSNDQNIFLSDHGFSCFLNNAGQINAPEFLASMVDIIRDMGGDIRLGVTYASHDFDKAQNKFVVHTDKGVFYSDFMPVLATGALHQQNVIGAIFQTKIIYTMCCLFGPFSSSEFDQITKRPISFCDLNLEDDVLWGGIDEHHYLTVGCGAEENENQKDNLVYKIEKIAQDLFPKTNIGKAKEIYWGATLHAPNTMPIVGRLKNMIVAGGWAGVGIVPAFVAGRAIAEWFIYQNETRLLIFEKLQPTGFQKTNK